MRMVVNIFGDTLLDRELLRVGDRAVSAKPAFEHILGEIEDINAEHFEGEGKFVGGWTPLKPETIAFKAKHDLRPEIEQATGALLDAMTIGSHGGDNRLATDSGLQFGVDTVYARAQHKGRPEINLPARPLAAFTEAHKRNFVRGLQGYVMTGKVTTDMRMAHNK